MLALTVSPTLLVQCGSLSHLFLQHEECVGTVEQDANARLTLLLYNG